MNEGMHLRFSFVIFLLICGVFLFLGDVEANTKSRSARSDISSKNFKLQYDKRKFNFWIKYLTVKDKVRFIRHIKNGEKFEKIVLKILKKHGLPKEIFYVGLIESGFNMRIRSRANAVGPWQFMKGTAKEYGLKINSRIDERKNIYKSTEAAAHYFKDLYNIFGSWELALCAYNAGEYKIIRAIRKGNTRDYRKLVKKKLLPKETVYYIPKIAAAMEIFKNRKRYGLPPYGKRRVYRVKRGDSLTRIAKKFKTTVSRLIKYNSLKTTRIYPAEKIYIPKI